MVCKNAKNYLHRTLLNADFSLGGAWMKLNKMSKFSTAVLKELKKPDNNLMMIHWFYFCFFGDLTFKGKTWLTLD